MPTPKPSQQSDPVRSMQESNAFLRGYLSRIEAVKENQTLEQLYRDLDVQLTKSASASRQARTYADKLLSASQESAAILESISAAMKTRIGGLRPKEEEEKEKQTTDVTSARDGNDCSKKTEKQAGTKAGVVGRDRGKSPVSKPLNNRTPRLQPKPKAKLTERDISNATTTLSLYELLIKCSNNVDEQMKIILQDVVDTAADAAKAVPGLQTAAGLQALKQKVVRDMPDIEAMYRKQYDALKSEANTLAKQQQDEEEQKQTLEQERQDFLERQRLHEEEIQRRAHEEAQRRIKEEMDKIRKEAMSADEKVREEEREKIRQEEREKRRIEEEQAKKAVEERKKLEEMQKEIEVKKKIETAERDRQRKIDDEKRIKEEAESLKRNSDLWPFFIYPKEKLDHDDGVACIIRSYPSKVVPVRQGDIRVTVVSDDEYTKMTRNTFEAEEGEELCSSVIKVESKKGNLKFEVPARIAIPCICSADDKYYSLVLNVLDEHGIWNDFIGVETKFTDFEGVRFLETNLARLAPKLCIVIVSRLKKDDRRLAHIGGTLASNLIEGVTLMFPKGALNESRHLEISVEPVLKGRVKQLEKFNDACCSVRSTGPVVRITNLGGIKEFGRPVIVTLPDVPCSEEIEDGTERCLAELTEEGKWTVRLKRRITVEDGKLRFEIRSPRLGFIVMRMDKPLSTEECETAATCINNHVRDYTLKMVLKQKSSDPGKLTTNCVIGWKAEKFGSEVKDQGYDSGPPIGRDFLAKDGQRLEIRLHGNIKNEQYNHETIPFVYRRNMPDISRREFGIEVKNPLLQHFKSEYQGFVQVWRHMAPGEIETEAESDDVSGGDENKGWHLVADFSVAFPKTTRASTVKGTSEDPLDEIIFEQLSNSMENSQRLRLMLKLDSTQEGNDATAYDPARFSQWLWDWYCKMKTHKQQRELFEQIKTALKTSGSTKFATQLQQWGDVYKIERDANIGEDEILATILEMASSAHIIIMNWKYVVSRLEPRLQDTDISNIDSSCGEGAKKEKCVQAFNLWQEKVGGAVLPETFIDLLKSMEYHATAVKLENELYQMRQKIRLGQEVAGELNEDGNA